MPALPKHAQHRHHEEYTNAKNRPEALYVRATVFNRAIRDDRFAPWIFL
jgi:hypothetical protein